MILHAPNQRKLWDIDKGKSDERLAYFEKIAVWGENESLRSSSFALRDVVE